MKDNVEIIKKFDSRIAVIFIFFAFCFILLIARLWYLQIYKGEVFFSYSRSNTIREQVIFSSRGNIYDRNYLPLVENRIRYDLSITPQYLPKDKKIREALLAEIANIIGISLQEINKKVKYRKRQANYLPILLKKELSFKEIAIFETQSEEYPGVSISKFKARHYLQNESIAHVVGHVGEVRKKDFKEKNYEIGEYIGYLGIEKKYDADIRGKNGLTYVEVDAFGRKREFLDTEGFFSDLKIKPPVSGNAVILTIDKDLQKVAYEAFADQVGAFVMLDVNSGEVLSLVSTPAFNPNIMGQSVTKDYWKKMIKNKNRPFKNKAIQEHYAPGSTFKIISALSGIKKEIITKRNTHTCDGSFKLGRRVYHCWKKEGHGKVNLNKAIRESCNVYFYKNAALLGINEIALTAQNFGLGYRTGIDLPNEISGLIPTKEWKKKTYGKKWQKGETLSCSIGQSYILTTPMQLANAYAFVANEGNLLKPYLVKQVLNEENQVIKEGKKEIVKVVRDLQFLKIKEGLAQVVNHPQGTAYRSRSSKIPFAGKTGTSQVVRANPEDLYKPCEKVERKYRNHAIFAGYAPLENPQVSFAVVVEHGCHGSSVAAPIAKKVLEKYAEKYLNYD